ncbi:unnamed protein product [Ectocarpus fasciculatus]
MLEWLICSAVPMMMYMYRERTGHISNARNCSRLQVFSQAHTSSVEFLNSTANSRRKQPGAVAGGGPIINKLPTAQSIAVKNAFCSGLTPNLFIESLFSFFTGKSLVALSHVSALLGCLLALLRRATIQKLTVPTVGRFRTTGDAFLTTDRVVFCARKPHGSQNGMLFKGFDIPLQVLSGEKFEQPILFGANNLSGVVETNVAYAGSTTGATAPGFHATATPVINSRWRLSFRNGGFGTFLHAFYSALQRRRSVDPAVTAVTFAGSDDEWASLQATEVAQAVALDPTDGTVLLTAAPVAATAPPRPYGDL